jgi:hypothetical protein
VCFADRIDPQAVGWLAFHIERRYPDGALGFDLAALQLFDTWLGR